MDLLKYKDWALIENEQENHKMVVMPFPTGIIDRISFDAPRFENALSRFDPYETPFLFMGNIPNP
jgi:hypothetical protein